MRIAALGALALALGSCAFGDATWRRDSYLTTVAMRDAGDGRCSDPAPWTSWRACLNHDLAYEAARRSRCRGVDDPVLTSEQARLVADLGLAQQLAQDGYGELWITGYYLAVRWGGWWGWHFSGCSE